MYNFLVTGADAAWDLPAYEFETSRLCEYTSPALIAKFRELSAEAIEDLKSFPSLFAYEGRREDVRVGYLRRIKKRPRSILIEYEFDSKVPPIPFPKIEALAGRLDIKYLETGRTHWALKDEDLFEILHSAGLMDDTFLNSTGSLGRIEEMRFKVAFSFPGEKRGYVSEVADELKKRLPKGSLFYDKDFTAQLARPNLDTLLQKVYLNNSDLVVVFLSSEYETKEWCGLEWRAIREIIHNRSDDSVMFMRFDNSRISGTFAIDGYIDLTKHDPVQAARFILERVRTNELPSTEDLTALP